MGLLSRLFGSGGDSPGDTVEVADLTNGPGTYSIEVVGESYYQKNLERICGGRTEEGHRLEVDAFLVLEDDNPHDRKAVRIDVLGGTVGYLDRRTARSFRKQLAKIGFAGGVAKCSGIIVGGWDRGGGDRGYFGVKLDLPS